MEPSFTMLEHNLLVIMYFVLAFGTALLQAMPSLPAETIEAVDGIINDQNLPVLAKISKLFKCIADSGMGYYQQIVPKDTLTHPANRGGSLLNSNDVWSKGLRMLGIGVQPSMLQSGAVCFELSNVKEKRDAQIAANVALVENSNNSLAPVNGQERFLTVATSHTAAFCKAVDHGCKPEPNGSSIDCKIHSGLQELCSQGWPYFVLKAEVEEQWPTLPAFIQVSMNASNASFKQVNEIEAASLMATFIGHGLSVADSLQRVQQADPICKNSLDTIAYYVSRYGGGQGQALILFLSQFSCLDLHVDSSLCLFLCFRLEHVYKSLTLAMLICFEAKVMAHCFLAVT